MSALVWHWVSKRQAILQASDGILSATYNSDEGRAALASDIRKQSGMATVALGINVSVPETRNRTETDRARPAHC